MNLKRIYFFVCCLPLLVSAQSDGRQPVPPNDLRETDVSFSKRVWRVIDLREKQNRKAVWPVAPVNKILYNAITNGKLLPYRSDSLRSIISLGQFITIGNDTVFQETPVDPNDPSITKPDTIISVFEPQDRIYELLLMEEWYFDKKLSSMLVRIIAIAPLYNVRALGLDPGLQPLCWLKYHDRRNLETDCRDIFIQVKMFNKENSRSLFTFDDWFEQRQFSSFVVKTSNAEDTSIMDDPEVRKKGLEALIEAERLKQESLKHESDQYEE